MSLTPTNYDTLMALVYEIPALHPSGLAKTVKNTLIVLISINTVAVGLRVYTRTIVTRGAFGYDDMLTVAGYICYLVATVYAIQGCYYGLGTRDADLPSELYLVRGAQLLLWWQIPYAISIPLIKSAIAVQIMRFTMATKIRIPLWFVVGGCTLSALAGLIAVLVRCKPISANWSGMGTCGSKVPLLDLSYLFTAMVIISDFTCALVTFFLIRNLNMNARRKWSLVAILSVGVCASAFTILRVPVFKHYVITSDALYYQGSIALWSMLEEGVGMFATSLPSMGKLLKNYYGSSSDGSMPPEQHNCAGDTSLTNLSPPSKRGQFSATVVSTQGNWQSLDGEEFHGGHGIVARTEIFLDTSEAESQRGIISTRGSKDN